MDLATPKEMKAIDQETISSGFSKAIDLMEKAGKAVAGEVACLVRKGQVSIFCGKGNNGGDGLVAARYLIKKKRKVKVYLFGEKKEIKGEAGQNLRTFLKLRGKVFEVKNREGLKKVEEECRSSAVIIDALLGIGLKGEVTGLIVQGINLINSLKKKVIAVDIPSGLDGERGIALGACVEAFETVTFGLGKPGLFLAPGAKFSGQVKIVDIGLSEVAIKEKKLAHHLLERKEIAALLPRRKLDAHKGDNGHVLLVAGSEGLTGAACLTALGSLRSGAGLVTLGLPASLNVIAAAKLTEIMTKPLPETKERSISPEALSTILDFSKRCKAVAIGPGLSRYPETGKLVLELIPRLHIPVVIDADALFALTDNLEVLTRARGPLILTPHLGEMGRLVGKKTGEVKENKIEIARDFSKTYKAVVVLKGARTLIADSGGDIFINPTGNPSLASGGTGDVLTGIIASFLAQGLKPLEAAKLGVYLHGLAADEISLSRGPWGVIATDILNQLPLTMYNLAAEIS